LLLWILLPVVFLVAGPTDASLSVLPESGDVNTTFTFRGAAWKPRQKVTASYVVVANRGGGTVVDTDPRARSRARAVLVHEAE
jgi:hypothetical protein